MLLLVEATVAYGSQIGDFDEARAFILSAGVSRWSANGLPLFSVGKAFSTLVIGQDDRSVVPRHFRQFRAAPWCVGYGDRARPRAEVSGLCRYVCQLLAC